MEEIDKNYLDEALVAGVFPICHHGCALRDWLVITGPEAGQVWHDARVDEGGLRPYESTDRSRLTFTEWYLDWLDDALRSFGPHFASSTGCSAWRSKSMHGRMWGLAPLTRQVNETCEGGQREVAYESRPSFRDW
jgi:hypothetical protein